MQIKNSIALVTGANRGIGRALVESLLAQGASKVYAAARRVKDLESVVALDPKRVVALQVDVTSPVQLSDAAAKAKDVTLLINNAGVLDFGSVLEAPAEAFARDFDVNFYGPLHTTRAFAGSLVRGKGAVVNVLTVVALASMPGIGVYNASKAAAWSLTQSLRGDLGKQGVKVFAVFPGPVDTDMAKEFPMQKASPREVADEILAGIEEGIEDIFPDPMSKQVYGAWAADHKAVERQFASM